MTKQNLLSCTAITCPNCGHEIGVDDLLQGRFEGMREQVEAAAQARIAAIEAEMQKTAEQNAALEMGFLRKQLADLTAKLAELNGQLVEAKANELALLARADEVETAKRDNDLEIARQVHQKTTILVADHQKQISDLTAKLAAAQQTILQGPVQRQGEALEVAFESDLARYFPTDEVVPVAKGKPGADVIQKVCNGTGRQVGAICWELKNTKGSFQNGWITKVRQDARDARCEIAVIVSAALPPDIVDAGFGLVEGVWVVGLHAWVPLARALREMLLAVAARDAINQGRLSKADRLYAYATGHEFNEHIKMLVETTTVMKAQLDREKRAMAKLWGEREQHINLVTLHTSTLSGDVQGIASGDAQVVAELELDEAA